MQKQILIFLILTSSLLTPLPLFPQERGSTHCVAADFDPSKIAVNRYFYGRKVSTAPLFDSHGPSDPSPLIESSEILDSLFLPIGYYQLEFYYTIHYTNPEELQRRRERNYVLNEECYIKGKGINIEAHTPQEEAERILAPRKLAEQNQFNGLIVGRYQVTIWNEAHLESTPYYRSLKTCIEDPQGTKLKNSHPVRPRNSLYCTGHSEYGDIKEREQGHSTFTFLIEDPGNFSFDLSLLGKLDDDIVLEDGRVELYYFTGEKNEFLEKESYFLGKSEGILQERITNLKALMDSEEARLIVLEKQREDLKHLTGLLSRLLLNTYDKAVNVAHVQKKLLTLKNKLTQSEYCDILNRASTILESVIDISKIEQAYGKPFSELLQSLSPEQVQKAYEAQEISLDQKERLLQLIEIRNFISRASLDLESLSKKIEALDGKITKLFLRQEDVIIQEKLLFGEFYKTLKSQPTVLQHHSLW